MSKRVGGFINQDGLNAPDEPTSVSGAAGNIIAEGPVDNISQVTISSTGNATDFGDLTTNVYQSGACSSGTRAIRGGGQTTGSSDSAVNTMDYVTISSTGNATDFGDLLTKTRYGVACSSSTRGIFWGGRDEFGVKTNTIQYVTIASTGNATDFGDMLGTEYDGGALASPTRGVQAAGGEGSTVIQYVTIASTGNAIDFGDIDFSGSFNSGGLKASSNSTRGVWSGFLQEPVWTKSDVIQYITIATTGNSVDFGDLTLARNYGASMTGGDRALFVSGQSQAASFNNVIDYITITSLGNATDFGDLSYVTYAPSAASNAHGGL
jgi:hypothetical protein